MALATSPTGSVSGTGTASTIPIWSNSVTLGNSLLSQATTTITLTGGATATNTGFYNLASINDFLQYDLKNTSTGTSAQSTYSLTADNGSATTGFMSININNSTFTAVNNYSIGVANDCSVLAFGQDLYIANSHISKDIIFSTGKTASPFFDERFRLQNASNVGGALFTLGNSLVVRKAATQDSVALAGRAGGTGSFSHTITPTTLSASWMTTLPDGNVTLTAGTSIAGAIANTQVAVGNGTNTVAGSANLTWNGTTLATTGAGTFSTGVSVTGSTVFVLGFIASGSSNSTSAGNFPSASFRNLDITNNNGAALFFQSYDTSSTVRTGAGIAATFTAKGAATLDGILAFYTAISGGYAERLRISAAGNLLVGTTADTGLTGAGGVSIASTTDSTTAATGSIITAGGLGVAKRSFLGTIGATFKGNVLAGVQDATAAVAGQVGEPISSVVAAVAVAATGTVGNVTSITLQPGAWSIRGFAVVNGGATGLTAASAINISLVTTSATNGVVGSTMTQKTVESSGALANGLYPLAIFPIDVNIATATTYYLTEQVSYIAGAPTVSATLAATRTR